MADSYNKKEREKKRRKRKQNKAEKKKQKKADGIKSEEFMYVDEFGNLTPTPPDLSKKETINVEDIEVSTPKSLNQNEDKFVKNGVVKFFNPEKRYGFIEEVNTGTDYFVHEDNLIDRINEKDKVVFEIGAGPKGPIAINVKQYKEDQ
ncbi:MAG: cold shock domain-containing protein [Bacteroidota bacterium]